MLKQLGSVGAHLLHLLCLYGQDWFGRHGRGGQYRWYRRWCGGFWECYLIDIPGISPYWVSVADPLRNERPGAAHGTAYCEYYAWDWFGYKSELTPSLIRRGRRGRKLRRILEKSP